MPQIKQPRAGTYSLRQLGEMLGVPLAQMKNYSQTKGYGLGPSGSKSKYHKFTFTDIFRFALAHRLTECGFKPDAVGAALKAVPKPAWNDWASEAVTGDLAAPLPLILFQINEKWLVENAMAVKSSLELAIAALDNDRGLFILNLSAFCRQFFKARIQPYVFGDVGPRRLRQSGNTSGGK